MVYAEPIMRKRIQECHPDVLVVHSKGVALATYLIDKGLWNGPVVLSSPIPNQCEHLDKYKSGAGEEGDDEWEKDFDAVVKVLEKLGDKVSIGIGSSFDEITLIDEFLKDACLRNKWLIKKADGDHRWYKLERNWPIIGELLDNVLRKLV